MDMGEWIIIGVSFIAYLIVAIKQQNADMEKIAESKKNMEKCLLGIDEFSASQKIMSFDGKAAIGIDDQRNKICLIDQQDQRASIRVFTYKDILSSVILEDNTTIMKTVRSSQIGGALIGGLALGGAGAIIGGLSGKTRVSGKIKKIDLCLTMNDIEKPLHIVNFLNIEVDKENSLYKMTMENVRHWHGLIEVLIKRADIEDNSNHTIEISQVKSSSIVDELNKLSDLHESGIINQEEFQKLKTKLIE